MKGDDDGRKLVMMKHEHMPSYEDWECQPKIVISCTVVLFIITILPI